MLYYLYTKYVPASPILHRANDLRAGLTRSVLFPPAMMLPLMEAEMLGKKETQ